MRWLLLFLFIALFCGDSVAGVVTTLSLIEKDSKTTSNYPLTFGHVFKAGDVTQYVQARYNGTLLTTQCDVKTTYTSDSSVRFAVISVVLPSVVADSTNTIALETAATTASTGYLDKTAILATNIEDEIRLTSLSGSGYSGSLTADLNAQIASDSSPTYWLQGSVTTEILVRDGLNNSLEASWEVRFYPGTSFGPRVSHSIENMNADYRGIVNYNVDIQAGLPAISSKYTKAAVQHNENSRWRKVLWIENEPPETELHYNLPYLISTGAVMPYDTSLSIPEATIASTYSTWSATNHDIMGSGILAKYFPTTGGREDIGILPTWSARYLLSMDNRMKEIMLNSGEMAGHCPIHYRESNASKTFYRHPISIDDRPTVWTTMEKADNAGAAEDRLPAAIGLYGYSNHGWEADRAHQGSFALIPYIITGEKFFLTEMLFWASWNLSGCDAWENDYVGRYNSTGIISDQVRGEAWAFRNIVDAAAFAANSDIEKTYLTEKINNNITKWTSEEGRYPLNYWGIDEYATLVGMTSDVKYVGNPWQEDYMLLSLVHAYQQGFGTLPIISWYKSFNSGRFTGNGVNPYDSTEYRFPAQLTDNSYPATWAQYAAKFSSPLSSWVAPTSAFHDYRLIALAAARAADNTDAANWITNALTTSGFNWTMYNQDPTWAIMATEQLHHSLGTVLLGQ